MTARSLWTTGALCSLALIWPTTASAFCRTTTCEPTWSCLEYPDDCCIRDDDGCDTNGKPLSWPSSCVSFSIQEDGSPKRKISAEALEVLVEKAFADWTDTVCADSQTPSIRVENVGRAECGNSEYNRCTGNANVWMFRDNDWTGQSAGGSADGFDSSALAVTTVNFSVESALLYDADVELNSDQAPFTMPDEPPSIDLKSIVTHEAGHFLGFDHSPDHDATMYFAYMPGDIEPRSLHEDDRAAICAVYPTNRPRPGGDSCEPRRGFSPTCHPEDDEVTSTCPASGGCHSTPGRSAPSGLGLLFAGAAALTLLGRLMKRRNGPAVGSPRGSRFEGRS